MFEVFLIGLDVVCALSFLGIHLFSDRPFKPYQPFMSVGPKYFLTILVIIL